VFIFSYHYVTYKQNIRLFPKRITLSYFRLQQNNVHHIQVTNLKHLTYIFHCNISARCNNHAGQIMDQSRWSVHAVICAGRCTYTWHHRSSWHEVLNTRSKHISLDCFMYGSVTAVVCYFVCDGSSNINSIKDEAEEFGRKLGNICGTIVSCVHTSCQLLCAIH